VLFRSCDLPCGALAEAGPDGNVVLEVLLATLDGKTVLRSRQEGTDPEAVGAEAARVVLDDNGGRALLNN
jgi:porphobilinogen deaminase